MVGRVPVEERQSGARVPQNVRDRRAGKPDVEGHGDHSGLHDAENHDQILRPVGGVDGDPVAALKSAGEEGAGHRPRPFVDASAGPRSAARSGVDDEDSLAIGCEIDEIAQIPGFRG